MDEMTILFFSFVVCGGLIIYFIDHYWKESKQRVKRRLKAEAWEEERAKKAIVALQIIDGVFTRICDSWSPPEGRMDIVLHRYASEQQILWAHQQWPADWDMHVDSCDIWVANDCLYLLEPKESILRRAQSLPQLYDTTDKAAKNIINRAIPLGNIHYYKLKGEMVRTTHIVGGGNATYTGVTVNGIGFGEVKRDPMVVLPSTYDHRYIVFYYKNAEGEPLQTIYFGADSLDALIRTIPQFERQ